MSDDVEHVRKAYRKLETREILDLLQWAGIPEKEVRKCLKLLRLCTTTQKAKYPNADKIAHRLRATDLDRCLSVIFDARQNERPPPEGEVGRIRDFLHYPENAHENWDDMYSRQAKDKGHIRAYLLRIRQDALGMPDPLTQPQVNVSEKEVVRVHKRYLKAFKEDDLIDHTRFIDDYERGRKK